MATILRGDNYTESDGAPRPATFTFSDMASQGEDYITHIRAEARKLVEQAKAEADQIRQQAADDAKAAAEKEIEQRLAKQVGKEIRTLRPALQASVQQIESAQGEWHAHWRQAAIRLATAIAERIVRRELKHDSGISEEWLAEALTNAAGSSDVTVRLSPSDYDHLRGHGEQLAATLSGLGDARYLADPTITPGGCRVETRHGSFDQQLETQLARLEEELG